MADMDSLAHMSSLASLATSQIAQGQYGSPEQSESGGGKRQAEDGAQPQQRAKRNRYISIACNECKRRKIKCNGQTPCQRCGNLNLECVYAPNCCNGFKDTQEYKEMTAHLSSLQEQVNALYNDLGSLRAQLGQPLPHLPQHQPQPELASMTQSQTNAQIDPSLQNAAYPVSLSAVSPTAGRQRTHAQQQGFRGPTSNDYNFGVAKNSLQSMGLTDSLDGNDVINNGMITGSGMQDGSLAASPPSAHRSMTNQLLQPYHAEKDPIWQIPQEEALRLCGVYEDEIGLMFPVLDIEKVTDYARRLYRFMDAAHRSGLMQSKFPGADSIDDEDTNILKMVLAIAMIVEAGGRSDLGFKLFEFVQPAIDNLLLGNVGVKGIKLLAMTAFYEFHRDNEGTSWRIIGLTARLCIELGLHRHETYDAIQDESERAETMLLFWSIYVLDRRWSFGTGMPFALQDADIDSNMPKPEELSPYLSAMIQYSAIGSKVWRATVAGSPGGNGQAINNEDMGYLDYQVIQWHRNIPQHLRFKHPMQAEDDDTTTVAAPSRAGDRLKIILYLRANQMRILIYRPILHSATSIMQHREQVQTVVDVAKDTIKVLTHISTTTDLYRTQQMLFNAFLTSALAVLFLAVSHTPLLYADSVREEFYMALDLVRGFSKGSWVGKRLWKTIRVLKEVAPKLGLKDAAPKASPLKDDPDPSRSAAVAMAGLAGHNVDEMALFNKQSQRWSTGSSSANTSPDVMANDLTSLFEAVGGLQALGDGGMNGTAGNEQMYMMDNEGFDNGSAIFGGDEGLSNILKELF